MAGAKDQHPPISPIFLISKSKGSFLPLFFPFIFPPDSLPDPLGKGGKMFLQDPWSKSRESQPPFSPCPPLSAHVVVSSPWMGRVSLVIIHFAAKTN